MPLDVESYAEPEVAVAAVVVAAVASPPVRRTLRRGIVYGLAGLLVAGDKVAAAASVVGSGAAKIAKSASKEAASPTEAVAPAPAPVTA